jgi:CO/xanthine dehydrogenase FAD-binding subunit
VKVEGSEYSVKCDAVIKAIVERPDYSFLPLEFLDDRGGLKIDKGTYSLGKGVYAGGDFVSGPATVAEAINAGREAARAITHSLLGMPRVDEEAPVCLIGETFAGSCIQPSSRVKVPEASLAEKLHSLTVEETGTLDAAAVEVEAERCYHCGCVAVNSSDLAPALIALAASVKTSQRVIPAEDFFSVGVNTSTVLEPGEVVLEVEVPQAAPGTRSTFSKFALRKSIDFPIVNVAAAITSDGGTVKSARICLNSVYGVPLRMGAAEDYLVGKAINESTAEAAADAAVQGSSALLRNRYKIQIARTLVKRAILACAG